ncbi:MAG: translation initiation factor IF-2 [Bacteroidia bacterium]|nr:translation initiation factor IF-2 [Bacteroidia bacterium]
MEGNKQIYRLFKVAKELNVATGMLVEHLQGKGFDVENSPNTKLSGEQYDLLLKEYASEKLMRERAEQLSEKRKEDVRTVSTKLPSTSVKEEDPENDLISPEQLRNTIHTRTPLKTEPEKKVEPTPIIAKTEPKITPPVVEKPEPTIKEEPKISEPPKPEIRESGYKVIGKIDLDALNRPKPKTEKPPVPVVEEITPPVIETAEIPKEEKVEKVEKVEEVVEIVETLPVLEKIEPPVEKVPEEPIKEEKPQEPVVLEVPVAKIEIQTPEVKEENENKVIRAGDRTPQLSGLKVIDKIELPGNRRSKKKKTREDTPVQSEPVKPTKPVEAKDKPEGESAEEGDKKRRRRRKRKRKSVAAEGETPVSTDAKDPKKAPVTAAKKGKKEKPTTKEVDDSIRTTLSQMGKGASRQRQRLRRAKRDADALRREQIEQQAQDDAHVLELTEFITANEFANLINVPVTDIITKSFQLGMMISINQRLDAELLTIIAEEYGFETNFVDVTEREFEEEQEEDTPEQLQTRNPIITVMGHVDHGKTTLLDFLRKTSVTSQEAGGITQHIGAYEVKLQSGRMVTFLDTPGHEAFTAMRARGAKSTDVAIIVIAADDAVMPQTREAINHAQAAAVPMVFAINKMDKHGADSERIKGQLAEMNLLVEDWGGKYQSQEISALKGTNVDELLEKVILEADMLDLKANPDKEASGVVIESRLDKGRGNVATILVQNGTLNVGDQMVAGIHYGKVRALINQNGERIKKAGPSTPVQMLGLSGQPQAGDKFQVFSDEGKAREIGQKRSELFREQQFRQTKRITLEEIGRRRAIGNFKELNIIIRGDVDGSVEALSGALLKLSTGEVQVNIVFKAVGAISEADINLAIASDAIVIAFNVRPNAQARSLAEREEVDIRTYSIIYNAINDVRDALEGLLSPEIKEEIVGTAEVREVFKVTKVGNVAGALAVSGKIKRDDPVRIIREGVVIYDSKLASLKRFKDDAKEVISGMEFGFMVENYNDIHPGDVLESYHINEIKRRL